MTTSGNVASVIDALGERQRAILRELRRRLGGMSVDELVGALGITRTAVGQHLAVLERDAYVARTDSYRSGGRPGRLYVLTPAGRELFPRQYSWFSAVLLAALRTRLGEAELASFLRATAEKLAGELAPQVPGGAAAERLAQLVALMNELAFEAEGRMDGATPVIEAHNCVYHRLARECPEVCEFDLGLLSRLMQAPVRHEECMVRGGTVCRFRFVDPDQAPPAEG